MIYFYDTSELIRELPILEDNDTLVICNIVWQELKQIKDDKRKSERTQRAAKKAIKWLTDNSFIMVKYKGELESEYEYINNDDRIVHCAGWYYFNEPFDDDFIFITHDKAMYLDAIEKDIPVSLTVDVNEPINEDYKGFKEYTFSDEEWINFQNKEDNYYEILSNMLINEYIIIHYFDKKGNNCEYCAKKVSFILDGEECFDFEEIPYPKFTSSKLDDMKPKDCYQRCAMDALNTTDFVILRGKPGSGKAQPNNTWIPTPNGQKQLGDIKVGEYVFDRHGKPTKVLGVFPQGIIDNYKITFNDGRVTYCNDEHIWSCWTSRHNLKNFTIREMLEHGILDNPSSPTRKPGCRYKIPINEAVIYPEQEFKIHPYVIGSFLGDGCCKETALTFSSNDEESVKYIAELINADKYNKNSNYNYNWVFYLKKENQYPSKTNGVVQRFQTKTFFKDFEEELLTESYNKKIPEIYKKSSISQRLSLLQGLLDTDGSIDKKGRISFTSTSLQLIKDVQEVCWSLGFITGISEDKRENKYTTGVCYSLSIQCSIEDKINLFHLNRKKQVAEKLKNEGKRERRYDNIGIKSIEKVGQADMTCIYVDNDEHLYLTNDYIVTHNTLAALSYLMYALEHHEIEKIYMLVNPVATRDSARLGYLPGDKNSKILDSSIGSLLAAKFGDKIGVDYLIDSNKLELLPVSDIRGVSIPSNAACYVTESQNLTTDLMKLIIQRCEEGCKIIIEGDNDAQVDMSVYDGKNNGLRRAIEVFKGQEFFATVTLNKIHRSRMAEVANKM